ncbi:hypothetical protein NIM87_06335 [Devosia sp. XJ19-1]|uniref:Uncharacterized protein n=1 Tax=Devosia ureilytica TaxID=2952754 RepID=A0A9Q4FRT5_9HYPH|nr:hypothetical protein [Devosia ureilytica]MCP8883109.1 hypothetical protein [Devosia ureilytica]MCP8886523.1 hypothetical protein [Devosia ureilytica]
MRDIQIDLDVHRRIEAGRLSFEEDENLILRRLLGIDRANPSSTQTRVRATRSSGAYSTFIGRTPVEANNLKELLRRSILIAENMQPGLIERLSREVTPKGRHIVAKSPNALYPKAHLVEFAERLDDTWWFDSNVGKNQVVAYLRKIAKILMLTDLPTISKRSEKTTVNLDDIELDLSGI